MVFPNALVQIARSNIKEYLKSLKKSISLNQSVEKYFMAFRFNVYIDKPSRYFHKN
jgi:hypothetical protein